MTDDIVLMNVIDGVATITLNKPQSHNAFDEHLIASLSGKLDALYIQHDVHAVVLRGAGKSFSAGADINWMKRAADYSEHQNKEDAIALAGMLHKLYSLPKTTIACTQGAVFGGGVGLVACCDIVIAAADTKFSLSEVRLGLIPATISPYVLRALGERQCRRYFQTAEKFDADTAKALGLVHEVVSDGAHLDVELSRILALLGQNAPKSMAAAKALCQDLSGLPINHTQIIETATRIAEIRSCAEAKEGLSAFLEKRKPVWKKSDHV